MDKTKIRIISSTTTFYPLESEAVEAATKNDNLTLWSMLQYLKRELNEETRFFRSDDKLVVLQQWRDTLFVIETTENYSAEVLRMLLQTSREILIFLFGAKFEHVMGTSISLAKRQVFAKYVETYIKMCSNSYLALIGTILYDTDNNVLSESFAKCCQEIVPKYSQLNIFSLILFNNNNILSVYTPKESPTKLDPETLHILQIFEKVEYEELDDESLEIDLASLDPEYVENNQRARIAFLRVQRIPIACSLFCTRLSATSPLVLLIVTQSVKLTDEMRTEITKLETEVTQSLSSLVIVEPPPNPVEVLENLIHYVVIDRTNGTVMELPVDVSLTLLRRYIDLESDENANEYLFDIKKRLSSYSMTAMMKGYTTMIWGEMDLQFCYQLKFRDENGNDVKPTQVFEAPPFQDDNGVNYGLIASSLFPDSSSHISVYEVLSIYNGTTQIREVELVNQTIFNQFVSKYCTK